jgi:TRAP-type mannitol/chloroaromatic compound transport system permease small subunit
MRKILDSLYVFSGGAAAGLIALICLLVSTQVVLNLVTKILGTGASYSIPSYADFAGFFLAASSFLALAYTFTRGGHIRVTLFLGRLPSIPRLIAELFSLLVAITITLFTLWHMMKLVHESYIYNDVSPGMGVIHLWVPQSIVCLGLSILCIALIDTFVQTIVARRPVITQQETI